MAGQAILVRKRLYANEFAEVPFAYCFYDAGEGPPLLYFFARFLVPSWGDLEKSLIAESRKYASIFRRKLLGKLFRFLRLERASPVVNRREFGPELSQKFLRLARVR